MNVDTTNGALALGPYFHCQDSQNVDRPKIKPVATVIRSSRRSSDVPPDRLDEPPNMSDSPLPFPECSKMNTMRNRLDRMFSTRATTSSTANKSTGSRGRRRHDA